MKNKLPPRISNLRGVTNSPPYKMHSPTPPIIIYNIMWDGKIMNKIRSTGNVFLFFPNFLKKKTRRGENEVFCSRGKK